MRHTHQHFKTSREGTVQVVEQQKSHPTRIHREHRVEGRGYELDTRQVARMQQIATANTRG